MKFFSTKVLVSYISLLFILVANLTADELILKNGYKLTGKITGQVDDKITFDINFDSILIQSIINTADILNIEADNAGMLEESAFFEIKQQSKGLVLYKDRWLPKKHVELLIAKQEKIDKAKKITLFSLEFFVFLMFSFIIIIGIDFLSFGLKKLRIWRLSKADSADNRLHRRIPVNVPVIFSLTDGSIYNAVTANISLGGLLFTSDKTVNVSEQISIKIVVNNDDNFEVAGLVVRSEKDNALDKYFIGVSFIGLSHEQRQKIANIISTFKS